MGLLLLVAWLVLGISFSNLFIAEPVRFEPVEIDLVNDKTDRVLETDMKD